MNKTGTLRAVMLTASAVVLLAVIWIVIFTKASPKTPATAPQVSAVLAENGLIATDLTGAYREKWSIDTALKAAVGTEENDLRFDFFVFDTANTAERFRKDYQTFIREERYATPNIEVSEGAANFVLYTLKADGLYTVNVRVENTLVFAYCRTENAERLDAVMRGIGYFDAQP